MVNYRQSPLNRHLVYTYNSIGPGANNFLKINSSNADTAVSGLHVARNNGFDCIRLALQQK